MKNKFKILSIITICFLSMGLTACETMQGAGQDIENAGQSIQDAAD